MQSNFLRIQFSFLRGKCFSFVNPIYNFLCTLQSSCVIIPCANMYFDKRLSNVWDKVHLDLTLRHKLNAKPLLPKMDFPQCILNNSIEYLM